MFFGPTTSRRPPGQTALRLVQRFRRTYGRDEQTDIHTGQAIPVTIATIRYEMYFNVRSKADMSQLNLPHRSPHFMMRAS